MKSKRQSIHILLVSLTFLVLILDSKTALKGASDGINICTATVIPSLFPFLVISAFLVSRLTGSSSLGLHRLGRLFGIPRGAESILLIGMVGGYPIGAQCLKTAVECREITCSDAKRMMAFCNNAGPAFIFGIGSSLFQTQAIPLLIWGIQILSAILVSYIIPSRSYNTAQLYKRTPISFTHAVEKSIKTMAIICSWVILFRILLSILQHWVLWLLPTNAKTAVIGITELANGCCELSKIHDVSIKFILCSVFMSFGGLCVMMQTASVAKNIGISHYIFGKLLQTIISFLIAVSVTPLIFQENMFYLIFLPVLTAFLVISRIGGNKLYLRKKVVEIRA